MGGGAGAGTLFAIKAGVTGDISPKMGQTTSDGIAWSVPRGAPAAATPLVYNGYVYCCARNGGMISCYDAKTGKAGIQGRADSAGEGVLGLAVGVRREDFRPR